mmetsp:Transcript_12835/g.17979  ORF Transcript_12835/g.17979 Transcript_12835/m.17979 type:complete len:200 (+) Transcript_12835:601-1200(+)
MSSFCRRAASELPTCSPLETSLSSDTISICPREILVGTLRAWNHWVWPGSQPVGPGGTTTSLSATCPARAEAGTRFSLMTLRISLTSSLVKMKPMLPTTSGVIDSIGCEPPCSSKNSIKIRRIMVFLPISTTARPRSAMRICWNCLLPTLFAPTTRILRYSSSSDLVRVKYCALRSRVGILLFPSFLTLPKSYLLTCQT